MAEEPTCGQGLAQHAELPMLVGDLMGAVADNLGAHLPGRVASDEDSQHEKRVYENLMTRHREAAAMLRAIGAEMAGHREMPMGDHDLRALSSGDAVNALDGMIRVESQLISRVQQQLTEHRAILDAIRADEGS